MPIPIKNLFYMLCYAWNVLSITDTTKVKIDEYDDAYNLLARIFSYGIAKLIKSGFHRSYVENTSELSTIRGRIKVQESINRLSFQRKKLVCSYDEYQTDDIFNRILKYTIESLIRNTHVDTSIKKELKKQIDYFDNIQSEPPTRINRSKLQYNRNNITYKLLINIAIMIYDNTMVNEDEGLESFKDFFRGKQMEKVFELFILNFYKKHLSKRIYKVYAPRIAWPMDDKDDDVWMKYFDLVDNPEDRRTDTVIENKKIKLQLIIDAKYYKNTFVKAYMNDDDEKVRTAHLNQLRGYMLDSGYDGDKVGALIYPMTDNNLIKGEVRTIKDTPITVKTIDLNADWKFIENDMLDFVHRIEKVYKGISKKNNKTGE